MTNINQHIRNNIDNIISEILSRYYKNGFTVELVMKVIFLQSYLVSLSSNMELFEKVKSIDSLDNISKFNDFIIEYEIGLEGLLNQNILKNKGYDYLIQLIKCSGLIEPDT